MVRRRITAVTIFTVTALYENVRTAGGLASVGGKDGFSQADTPGGHFDQFIVADKGDGFFQCHGQDRGQGDGFVLVGGPHVAQLFGLAGIDVQVVAAAVLADDHAFIDDVAGADKQTASGFQVEQGKGNGTAGAVGYQAAGKAAGEVTPEGLITRKSGVDDAGAPGVGQKLVAAGVPCGSGCPFAVEVFR